MYTCDDAGMDSLAAAFLLIASISLIVITALLGTVLVLRIRILRRAERILEGVANELTEMRSDIAYLRSRIREGGTQVVAILRHMARSLQRFFRIKEVK